MKKLLSLIIVLLIFNSVLPLKAQDLIKNSSVTGVCYAGNKINRFYIPPPKEFFRKGRIKKRRINNNLLYRFFQSGKNCNGVCSSILETMLPADTKFTIACQLGKNFNCRCTCSINCNTVMLRDGELML